MKKIICLHGGPCSAKCLRIGTEVIKYDGSIANIEDLKIGDKLLGPDGKQRTVLKTFSGSEILYKIIPVKGEPFYTTEQHKLSLVLSDKKCGYKKNQIVNLTIKEILSKPKSLQEKFKLYKAEAIKFRHRHLKIDPYYLGLWLGDGNSDNIGRITTSDKIVVDYLESFAKSFNSNLNLKKVGKTKYQYSLSGSKQKHCEDLTKPWREYNLVNNKHIPKEYLTSSIEQRLQLLAGLMDSDGCLSKKNFFITTKFPILNEQILFLARSLGLAAYSSISYNKKYNKYYYSITIHGEINKIPTKLKRKQSGKRLIKKNPLRTGFSIEKQINKEEYFGVQLDGDNLFLLKDFTVTHNSTICAGLYYELQMCGYECEMNREHVKEWIREGRTPRDGDQSYFFAEMSRKERIYMDAGVDFIITDSPLLCTHFYGMKSDRFEQLTNTSLAMLKNHHALVKDKGYTVDHFFLERTGPYKTLGRFQTEEEAKVLDKEIKQMLVDMNIKFECVYSGQYAVNVILEHLNIFSKVKKIILGEAECQKSVEFMEKHRKEKTGAIGGQFTWTYTPTSIGSIVEIIDNVTHEKLDITEYDLW